MPRARIVRNGRINFSLSKGETNFIRHALVNWLTMSDIEYRYEFLSREDISRLEDRLIIASESFSHYVDNKQDRIGA
jgi:hypothetical protein